MLNGKTTEEKIRFTNETIDFYNQWSEEQAEEADAPPAPTEHDISEAPASEDRNES